MKNVIKRNTNHIPINLKRLQFIIDLSILLNIVESFQFQFSQFQTLDVFLIDCGEKRLKNSLQISIILFFEILKFSFPLFKWCEIGKYTYGQNNQKRGARCESHKTVQNVVACQELVGGHCDLVDAVSEYLNVAIHPESECTVNYGAEGNEEYKQIIYISLEIWRFSIVPCNRMLLYKVEKRKVYKP